MSVVGGAPDWMVQRPSEDSDAEGLRTCGTGESTELKVWRRALLEGSPQVRVKTEEVEAAAES